MAQYSVEELLLVIAYLWMYMVKHDIDSNQPSYDYGRDTMGLIPQPAINSPLCASLGHRWHGREQDLGLDGFDLTVKTKVKFDRDRCGFLWETQFCNFMKFKFSEDTVETEVIPQLKKIRVANQIKGFTFLPKEKVTLKLTGDLADPFPPGTAVTRQARYTRRAISQHDAMKIQKEIEQQQQVPTFDSAAEAAQAAVSEADSQPTAFPGTMHEGMQTLSTPEGQEGAPSFGAQVGDDFIDTQTLENFFADVGDTGSISLSPLSVQGRRNMRNMGSTCYMSSVLQVVANVSDVKSLGLRSGSTEL